MEKFYAEHVCFVTGATGFVGKVLVEKLLRWQPTGPLIYVLIRPRQDESATDRLHREIVGSPIFTRLKKEIGEKAFSKVVARRLRAVEGDLLKQNVGLAPHTYARLKREVSIVLHIAASVNFNADLATATQINVVAALEMQRISQEWGCIAHVHVSTAYVNSDRVLPNQKFVREKIYGLDFDAEAVVRDIQSNFGPSSGNARNMFALEAFQAKIMGNFPNTYTLTKSMAENLLAKHRGDQALVIVRPSIIGSAWREPVPGWVDNVSAAGAVFLAGGLGLLKIIPGDMRGIADIVPVDTVVNYILVSALSVANTNSFQIVHAATSSNKNFLRWRLACTHVADYFRQAKPKVQLRAPSFKLIGNAQQFEAEWILRYQLPSYILKQFSKIVGSPKLLEQAAKVDRAVAQCQMVVQLFTHFTSHEWIFQSEVLPDWLKRNSLLAVGVGEGPISRCSFSLSTEDIVWPQYLKDFSYGLNFYVLKEDIYPIEHESDASTALAAQSGRILDWDADHHSISYPGLFKDAWWIYTSNREAGYFDGTMLGKLMHLTGWQQQKIYPLNRKLRPFSDPSGRVLKHPLVRKAISDRVKSASAGGGRKGRQSKTKTELAAAAQAEAREMIEQIAASDGDRNQRMLGYVIRKVLRNLYEDIIVDFQGITRVRALVEEDKAPVVLLPTHRSYVDFLLVSYIFFTFSIDLPFIAAAEDFLGMGFVTAMLRDSRAFFLKRGGFDDKLYATLFGEYVADILRQRHSVEFFIEGTRSRSGKQLAPKKGLLKSLVQNYLNGKVSDVVFVPVVIDYEKVMELAAFAAEMLGYQKRKESLKELVGATASVLRSNYGTVAIKFSREISLKSFIANMEADAATGDNQDNKNVPLTADKIATQLQNVVTQRLVEQSLCMPTHLMATIFLAFRQGLTLTELQSKFDWLYELIKSRGGSVRGVEAQRRDNVLRRSLKLLGELVHEQRKDFFIPTIFQRQSCVNALSLGYLKNKLFPLFYGEAKLACILQVHFPAHQSHSVPTPISALVAADGGESSNATGARTNTTTVKELALDYLFLSDVLQFEDATTTQESLNLEAAQQAVVAHLQKLRIRTSTITARDVDNCKPVISFLSLYIWFVGNLAQFLLCLHDRLWIAESAPAKQLQQKQHTFVGHLSRLTGSQPFRYSQCHRLDFAKRVDDLHCCTGYSGLQKPCITTGKCGGFARGGVPVLLE
eukprot:INCI17608.4.p1 GENE.INCI17608.4~~INCI17608.4.p1  ORF type:complete len:1235 (+),score=194.75 INCI17608.4:93-3707(+)